MKLCHTYQYLRRPMEISHTDLWPLAALAPADNEMQMTPDNDMQMTPDDMQMTPDDMQMTPDDMQMTPAPRAGPHRDRGDNQLIGQSDITAACDKSESVAAVLHGPLV